MVIKVYVALISSSQETKKNQQRAVMILDSKNIPYTITDITDPANEDSKDYMVETATPKEGFKIPVTPQIYNEADYCGDYDGLDMANECDTLGDFLKMTEEEKKAIKIGITGIIPTKKKEESDSHITNGVSASREGSPVKTTTIKEPEVTNEIAKPVENSPNENADGPALQPVAVAEVSGPAETVKPEPLVAAGPVEPPPAQPAPAQPAPVQPAPAQPDPVQPAPAQPDPVQPAPAQPAPANAPTGPPQPPPAQPAPAKVAANDAKVEESEDDSDEDSEEDSSEE